jgi:hypothetical protein
MWFVSSGARLHSEITVPVTQLSEGCAVFHFGQKQNKFGYFRKFQEFPEVSLRISLSFLTFIGIS